MKKLLFMLCITSGLTPTTTFTMKSDKPKQTQTQSTDQFLTSEQLARYFNFMVGIDMQNPNIYPNNDNMFDFQAYHALDSWAYPEPEYKTVPSTPYNQENKSADSKKE